MGFNPVGLDISPKLITLARKKYPEVEFLEGDAEHLPFLSSSLDGVLLSGLVQSVFSSAAP
jgi:demethylmenaquinone methyltransferase/2-methoxy-6-polyprenyl-1,4-benzoquinol methylase